VAIKYDTKANIGVFDSGIGGEALAKSLRQSFYNAKITVLNDKKHLPYGSKSKKEVIRLTDAAIQPLIGSNVIVIACNTATALAIDFLRDKYPSQKFVGIEPMVKTASLVTKSNIIGICATPATLASERYKKLLQQYAQHLEIIEPDCSNWAEMIEKDQLNKLQVTATIQSLIRQQADVIVLGCTHYHWIKQLIVKLADHQAAVLEPSDAIAKRVARVLHVS
jgi:glutamate racemase